MDQLQNELESVYPLLNIQILGVNEKGQESANALATNGRDLPWLQDVDADQNAVSDVWYDKWDVVYRDVVILDGTNSKVGVFNVTEHNLATASEYSALRTQLLDAALASQKPWQNPTLAMDVDNDGVVAPRDVLVVINTINRDGARKLPAPTGSTLPEFRYDANGDGFVAPGDVLQVINYINLNGNGGEGEFVELAGGPEGLPILSPQAFDRAELPQALRTSQPAKHDDSAEVILFGPNRSSGNWSAARLNLVEEHERSVEASYGAFWNEDWLSTLYSNRLANSLLSLSEYPA